MSFWQGIPVARDDWNSEIGVATECFIKSMILMNLNSFFLSFSKIMLMNRLAKSCFRIPAFCAGFLFANRSQSKVRVAKTGSCWQRWQI